MESDSDQLQISTREVTRLDQLVQILEISFIFLLTFSLVALIDAVVEEFDLYQDLSTEYLGRENIGSLEGGNWEQIVRITLLFNILLFAFSLFFGLWIRRTRDGWTLKQMGYSLRTEKYTLTQLARKGVLLGLIGIIVFYSARGIVVLADADLNYLYTFSFYKGPDELYTPRELRAEFYFGIVEMAFVWPLSACFFFFAYTHNSLRARFPVGVANVLSTFFYVF